MMEKDVLQMSKFFPADYLKITNVIDSETKIIIRLKSVTRECECPSCKTNLTEYHGTYVRKVQDLPILGKSVQLMVNVREYQCRNEQCEVTTITESYNGFLDPYSRMTERCADFICILAMETSCEGSARICKAMNISVSGDTIIRPLTKRYGLQEKPICGEVVGVDDFALKKRHRYGTIIVDEATRKPITLLEGRDGKGLKEWLQKNKHIKAVTRDIACAYASAIQEVLPDAMQIADRFHLYQNLLEAVKETLKSVVPVSIKIPKESETESEKLVEESDADNKKRASQCG